MGLQVPSRQTVSEPRLMHFTADAVSDPLTADTLQNLSYATGLALQL